MITVRNLSFAYSQKCRVFDDLSFTLPAGEIVGLLGRNGVGKSTLIKLLAGVTIPDSGQINIEGLAPKSRSAALYNNLIVVPEELLLPKVSVKNFVRYTAPLYSNFSHQQFVEYCSLLEIDSELNFSQMSMGQRKKAYLAFVLACNARILLLDEPTNGLDITAKTALRSILASYIDDTKTIIISTHQAHDIENLTDRIVILEEGNILINNTVSELQQYFGFGIAEGREAIYSTASLAGNVGIWAAEGDEESRFDLELLFNAAMKSSEAIQRVIAQKRG